MPNLKAVSHTPGPWTGQYIALEHDIDYSYYIVGSVGDVTITVANIPGVGKEVDANARLIAAAPSLLEAALALVRSTDYADDARPLMGALRTAIRQATGEEQA